MATFATGDQSLNYALGNLATALFPDPMTTLNAAYRRAQTGNTQAATRQIQQEMAQAAAAQRANEEAARTTGEFLVERNLGDLSAMPRPGISDVIAGPPTPATMAGADFLRAAPGAILAREGNPAQAAEGLGAVMGLGNLLTGDQGEDAQRQAFGLYTREIPQFEGGEAITAGTQQTLLDDIQNAALGQAVAEEYAKEEAKARVAGAGGVSAPGGFTPLEGTGMDQQAMNLVTEYNVMLDQGQTPTPQQEVQYGLLYNRLFAPKPTPVLNPQTGNYELQMVRPPVPAGIRQPRTGPVAAAPTATPAAAGAVPAPPVSEVLDPAAAPAQAPAPLITKRGPSSARTEAQARNYAYSQRVQNAMTNLFGMLGYDPGSGRFAEGGFRPSLMGDLVSRLPDFARGYFQSGQDQRWYTTVSQALNPIIRADSGAAVPEQEYPRYYSQYIPLPGENDATVKSKMDQLLVTQAAMDEVSQVHNLLPPTDDASETEKARYRSLLDQSKARIAREQNITLTRRDFGQSGASGPAYVIKGRVQ